jgi:hypothetical protein
MAAKKHVTTKRAASSGRTTRPRYSRGQLVWCRFGAEFSRVGVVEETQGGIWVRTYMARSDRFGQQHRVPPHEVKPLGRGEGRSAVVVAAKARLEADATTAGAPGRKAEGR